MTASITIRNALDRTVQFLMEPSGHCLDMPAGATFVVVPASGETLVIEHRHPDVMVRGDVARVTHDGVELASWEDADEMATLGSPAEMRQYLQARGERIFATPEGATVMREIAGESWAAGVMWSDAQGLLLVTGGPPVEASPTKEAALQAAVAQANSELLIPGFRVARATPTNPTIGVTYAIVLLRDAAGAVPSSVLDRSLELWFETVVRHARDFEAAVR